jgi:hypothetical protein
MYIDGTINNKLLNILKKLTIANIVLIFLKIVSKRYYIKIYIGILKKEVI